MQPRPTTHLETVFASSWPLLCGSTRLRRHHLVRHADLRRRTGATVWPAPRIDSLDAWLARLREQLIDDGLETATALGNAQELALWEHVIDEDLGAQGLLQTRAAARAAVQASHAIHAWQLSERAVAAQGSAETAIFLRWHLRVGQICAERGWRVQAETVALVTDALTSGTLAAPATLVLAGLQPGSPATEALWRALEVAGTRLMVLASDRPPATAQLTQAADPDGELEAIASWCAARLGEDPDSRLAVASPALYDHAPQLADRLSRTLHPETYWPGAQPAARHVHTAGAGRLSDTPAVDAALLVLTLAVEPLDLEACGALLRSPFIPDAGQELSLRAALDARLRRDGRRRIGLEGLIRAAEVRDAAACPLLAAALIRLRELVHRQAPVQPLEAWARYFGRALRRFGWPGEALVDPLAAAAERRLADLLPDLAQLGPVVGACGATQALGRLRDLAADTSIESPTGEDARVQIVSLVQAAHMDLDGLWVMGLDDTAWPAPAQPLAFLPASLQRACGMPGASAAQSLNDALAITAQLRGAASDLRVSFAATQGEQERRASALLSGWTVPASGCPPGAATGQASAAQRPAPDAGTDDWLPLIGTLALERLEERHGRPLPAGGTPASPAPGGTALLADQSDCPFRAYLKHRLGVAPLEDPAPGIDPRLTGTLVHRTLEFAWERLRDGQTLKATDDQALADLTARAVQRAVATTRGAEAEALASRLGGVEIARITRLVERWLQHEQGRQAPFTVIEREQRSVVALGPIWLDVRADRVDRLDDGGLIIIDYKTGQDVNTRGWDRERLAEPQVPLYALTRPEPVTAVALASLRADRSRFFGRAARAGVLPGVSERSGADEPTWAERLAVWRDALEGLATEAATGLATVTPVAGACRYCPFPAVCRVSTGADPGGEGDPGGDALEDTGLAPAPPPMKSAP